ncbi:MAG: glycosyltransferase [Solirubrobacteraceae bacterium]
MLEQRSLQAATHVLAANESHRAVALERARLSPGAVTVVRNGPPAADLRAPAGNGGSLSEPALVFVGSMAEQDGVVELPEILRELEARHGVRGRLLAVGEGPSRAALAERCRELGLEGRVELPGRLPHDEVPARLAEADICVDPAPCSALNHRSTMVKIAEYLAAARPVVAYRLRETEHTAGDAAAFAECGDRGAFVDAIARLAGDGAERERLAELGRLRADELTWERSEQALLNVYSRL